jgi:hypothetical protein
MYWNYNVYYFDYVLTERSDAIGTSVKKQSSLSLAYPVIGNRQRPDRQFPGKETMYKLMFLKRRSVWQQEL